MPNYNLKIDVTKILKEHLFHGKNGAKYLDITLWENRDGEDQYGNTHMAVQSIPKELRDAGQKGPILGNAKEFGQTYVKSPEHGKADAGGYKGRSANQNGAAPPRDNSASDDVEDDVPFSRPNINWP